MPASLGNILPLGSDAITRNPVHASLVHSAIGADSKQRFILPPSACRLWLILHPSSFRLPQHAVRCVDADDSADESARDDVTDKVIIHAQEADGHERGGDDASP